MVDTIKFSEMPDGGNINNDEKTPSILGGVNVLINNPWTFLPPGTTAQRPAPSSVINYRLRFNTDDQLYEYYDATASAWTQLQESAFTVGPFVTYTADASLPDAQNLGALADGILRQTISAGIATLDILGIPLLGAYGGTGIANTGLTINLSAGAAGYVMTSDSSGNATWAAPAYLTGAVLLSPSGNQTITAHNLTLATGSMFATAGSFSSGVSTGGFAGTFTAYSSVIQLGSISLQASNNAADYANILTNASTSAARTWTLPDASGTVALAGSSVQTINGDSGSATPSAGVMTFTGATTGLTFTGSGSTMTLGGLLGPTYGGTGVNNGTSTLTLAGNLSTVGAFASAFTMTGATTVTFPTSGTLATTSQLPTPAALTKTDDTNVTLSLGGTPASALLQAVSLTLGWTGTLSGTRGGTGINNGSNTATYAGNLNFAAAFTTSGAFAVTQTYTGITSVTFPTSGTLATTAQIPTGAALTKTDDTNVTLTLGGSPTTALLNAASLTLGWTGQLGLTRGGTNNSLTASAGGIVWSDASKLNILAGTSTANQLLLSGNAATPSWSTTTYPSTNAINTIMYASSANVLGVITPVNSAVMISSAGGVPSFSTTLPSGIAATNMALTTPSIGAATATSINFGGTSLANYVESTWTPIVTLVGGAGNTVPVYTTNVGVYTRIGNVCYCSIALAGDGGAEGAGTGTINISLPIVSSASTGNLGGIAFDGNYLNGATRSPISLSITAGITAASLFYWPSITTGYSPLTGADQNNTSRQIYLRFWYLV